MHREPDGARGYGSLVVLTAVCATIAWAHHAANVLSFGADFVILTMALAVALAIVVAAMSWAVKRANGPRLLSALAEQVVFVMVPPLLLIFLVLGTIFIGVATPDRGRRHGRGRRHAARVGQASERRQPGALQLRHRALGRPARRRSCRRS